MTVKLLINWTDSRDGKAYVAGNLITTDAGTEAGMVAAKIADSNTAGGTARVDTPDTTTNRDPLTYDPATGKAYANGVEVAIGGGGVSVGTPVNFSASGSIAPGPSKVYKIVVKTGSALTLTLYDSPNTAGGTVIWSATGLAASIAEVTFPTPYQAINGVYASVTGSGTFDLYIG